MVIPYCKKQKFVDFLLENGCKIISNKYWDEHNIVIFEKNGDTVPIILEDIFYYFKVESICRSLDIEIPKKNGGLYDVGKWLDDVD